MHTFDPLRLPTILPTRCRVIVKTGVIVPDAALVFHHMPGRFNEGFKLTVGDFKFAYSKHVINRDFDLRPLATHEINLTVTDRCTHHERPAWEHDQLWAIITIFNDVAST